MASILTCQGVVLATAMAVSGTVILLAFRLQKSLPPNSQFTNNPIPHSSQPIQRSCISSDHGKKREKKKKRVHFADDVVDPRGNSEEFRRQRSGNSNSSSSSRMKARERVGGMPANRVALYNGILRDRLVHRTVNSY